MAERDYNNEYGDPANTTYDYKFDDRMRDYFVRALEKYFPNRHDVLEVGCYHGDLTRRLVDVFADVTVMDASSESMDIIAKRFGERVHRVTGTIEDTTPGRDFSTIFLVHTLEHFDNPSDGLRQIASWLKPDGRLLVAVPNANAASRQIAVEMGIVDYNGAVTESERVHGHRNTFSIDTLINTVRKAGLSVIETGGVFFKPLANYQFDALADSELLNEDFYEGCYRLGFRYPDLCASIFAVVERPKAT